MAEENKITFKYKYNDDYNPVYINGAYGGVTSKNEIVINYFLGRSPIPKETTQKINSDGSLNERISFVPEDFQNIIIRYVSTGVIMNLDTAKSIYNWLGNNIEELEKRVTNADESNTEQENDIKQ